MDDLGWHPIWHVVEKLVSDSYHIHHCLDNSRTDKKHASHLSVYPEQLFPFKPINDPDNCYGQVNVPIGKSSFGEAIKGLKHLKSFCVATNFSHVEEDFHRPSLQELNEELNLFPWAHMGNISLSNFWVIL